jgi:hypothetical protein
MNAPIETWILGHPTRIFLGLTLLLALGVGCAPTLSPPMRSTHFGAPGRATSGEGLVQIAGTNQGTAAPTISLPVADDLHVEIGGDARPTDEQWAMGSVGVRYTLGPPRGEDGRRPSTGPYGDVEFGLGAGVGGVGHDEDGEPVDSRTAWERFAYGGYVGTGFGWRFLPWLAGFTRTRVQLTKATNLPETTWFSAMAGPELTWGALSLHLGGGWAGYSNDDDADHGPLFEAGLGCRF